MGMILDPRLASWAEMCAIGRAFVVRHPTRCYAPSSDEFKEMVAVYLGPPPPLATPKSALAAESVAQTSGARTACWTSEGSHYWWAKSPADPPILGDPATTPLRTSSTVAPSGLASKGEQRYGAYFRASYPPQTPVATTGREMTWSRTGPGRVTATPDGARRRVQGSSARHEDHPHMAPSTYSVAMVKEKSVARSPNARADKVNGQYLTKARKLDTECVSSEPEVEARPVLRRLRWYPKVRGQCVLGAFRHAARTSICCYWRRPAGPRPCAIGAKLGLHLWRRLSRPTRLGTAAIRELNEPFKGRTSASPGHIPGLPGPILPGWYDLRDLFYRF